MRSGSCDVEVSTKMGDRELAAELRKLCDVLSGSVRGAMDKDNWKERLAALRGLFKLARGDISNCHGFLSLMSMYVKVPLQRHIEELRTVLSTEACYVVSAFAQHSSNRSAWRVATEWFVSSLLQLTTRTNRSSLLAAIETLETLARKKSFGPAAFAELLRGCTARHAATRRNAFGVLQVIIKQGQNDDNEAHLSNFIDAICRVLRSGLADADHETRRRARVCFWILNANEPEAAETLYKGLENSVRRSLDRKMGSSIQKKKEAAVSAVTQVLATKKKAVKNEEAEAVKESPLPPQTSITTTKRHGNNLVRKLDEGKKEVEDMAESWALVQDALRSTLWSERLLGLRRLSEEFPRFRQKAECVNLLTPRLNDPNSRVSQMAIQALGVIMRVSPNILKDCLPEVITALLVNMSGNKEVLSSASREHLARIIQLSPVDDVARAIYRTIGDVVAPKVKVHAVEYAQYLYEQNATHFEQASPMHLALHHLLQCLKTEKKGGDFYKATLSALTALYVSAATNFLRILLQFSPGERDAIVEALETAVPHLGQECRRRLMGERPLQHAPLHVRSPFEEKLRRVSDTQPKTCPGTRKQRNVRQQEKGIPFSSAPSSVKKTKFSKKVRSVSSNHERPNGRLEKTRTASCDALNLVRSPTPKQSPFRDSSLRTQRPSHCDPIAPVEAPLSRQIKRKTDDASDLLDLLEEACEMADTCAILHRIQNMIVVNPRPWLEVFGRLLVHLERIIPQSNEPNHAVRRRGLLVLQSLVGQRALQRPIIRSLKQVFLLARVGMDDAFPEVHVEATSVLQLVLSSGIYSTDHILNAIAMSLENWLSDESGYCSRGWLTLLESVEHVFSLYGRTMMLVQEPFKEYAVSQDCFDVNVSETVFRRLCNVVVQAVQHTGSEVRLTAVLVLVSIWMGLDTAALPYLVGLSASQRKLVSLYYNKVASERRMGLHGTVQQRDLSREMRVMRLPAAECL
ncbi:putative CLASP N terminal, partial [Trypanosoma cruzi]